MAKLHLLYQTVTGTTPTVSSEDASFPALNLADWHSWSRWKAASAGTSHAVQWDAGTATACDCAAIYNHSLVAGQTCVVQWSTSGAGSWTTVATFTGVAPSTALWPPASQALMASFVSVSARYWRLLFSSGSAFTPSLGVAAIGPRLLTERSAHVGMKTPRQARVMEILNNVSDAGNFLGRSIIDRGVSGSIELEYLSASWVESTWMPFSAHASRYPFFLSWPPVVDGDVQPCVFAWTPGAVDAPEHSHVNFQKASLAWQGRT